MVIGPFHLHLYFTQEIKDVILQLRQKLSQLKGVTAKGIYDRPVGPHKYPMCAFDVTPEEIAEVVVWVTNNASQYSILVHPNTGDELKDHRDGAFWLGKELEIDLSYFDGH